MARRRIGQERLGFVVGGSGRHSCLAERVRLIDWVPVEHQLAVISCAAKGEPAWPPLALFKAMLIAVWYDLSGVKLAEALDDRASFRRFCGFSASEPTPERTAFVRFRKALIAHGLDRSLFEAITGNSRPRRSGSRPALSSMRRSSHPPASRSTSDPSCRKTRCSSATAMTSPQTAG